MKQLPTVLVDIFKRTGYDNQISLEIRICIEDILIRCFKKNNVKMNDHNILY